MSPATAGSASTPSSTDTPQTALDGGDGQDADKPPHGRSSSSRTTSSATTIGTSKTVTAAPHVYQPSQRGPAPQNMPLSIRSASSSSDNARMFKLSPPPSMPPSRPPSTPGSVFETESDSGSESDCETSSLPSTRANSCAPSRAQSRAPSMSSAVPGSRLEALGGKKEVPPKLNTAANGSSNNHSHGGPKSPPPVTSPTKSSAKASRPTAPSRTPSQSGSVRSEDAASHGTGQKFTLKDLLASAPKLARRASVRSTGSSKKSDSDGERRSVAGESTAGSLGQKYGVCGKVAIGKGATSVVRLAHKWDRTEEKLYAIKEFRKRRKNESEKEYVKKLTAEFCISSTLHHINVVETVDLVQDEQQRWCEVMEFCPGGDLYAAIKKGGMSPSEVECCFRQMLNGVAYLHSQGVAHRDIKPENLLFDQKGRLKVGDFGASTVYRLPWETTIHMSTGLCGSEPYIAPEQFLGKPYDARLVDVWACGIVYYCLHFQEIPWRVAQPSDELYAAYAQACSAGGPASACPPTINNLSPRACRPVLRKMLDPDPRKRSPIEEVMKEKWIEGIEVCHLVNKPSHVHVNMRAIVDKPVQPV